MCDDSYRFSSLFCDVLLHIVDEESMVHICSTSQ